MSTRIQSSNADVAEFGSHEWQYREANRMARDRLAEREAQVRRLALVVAADPARRPAVIYTVCGVVTLSPGEPIPTTGGTYQQIVVDLFSGISGKERVLIAEQIIRAEVERIHAEADQPQTQEDTP